MTHVASFIKTLCKNLHCIEQYYTGIALKITSQDVAYVAVFTAFSAIIIKMLPGIPIVGTPGANIKFDAVVAPIYGLVIGPYLGFAAALFGGLITANSPFDVLTSFSPAVSALVAGLLTQKSIVNPENRIKGWMGAAGVLSVLVLGWFFTDVGQQAPFYPILHIAGIIMILATRGWPAKVFEKEEIAERKWQTKTIYLIAGIVVMIVAFMFNKPYLSDLWVLEYVSLPMFVIGGVITVYSLFGLGKYSFALSIAIASYCGIIADHMLGNLVFIESVNIFIPFSWLEQNVLIPLQLPSIASLFMYMVPVSTVERILFTIVATIIGMGLILALRKTNLLTRKL